MKIIEYKGVLTGLRNHAYTHMLYNIVTPCGIGLPDTTTMVKFTTGKVTCPDCIRMIDYCKSIDSGYLQRGS